MYRKLIAVYLIFALIFGQCSFVFASGLLDVSVDKNSYKLNEIVKVSGSVPADSTQTPVTMVLTNKAHSAVYFIDEIDPGEDGAFGVNVATSGMPPGDYRLSVVHKSTGYDCEFSITDAPVEVERDLMVYAPEAIFAGSVFEVSGWIKANDRPVVGVVTLKITDEDMSSVLYIDQVLSQYDGKFFARIGTDLFESGNYVLTAAFGDTQDSESFEIVEDTFEADLKLSSDSIDYGQGISLSGQLIKNGQPVIGRAQIEVVLVTASGERVKHQTELLSDDNGTFKADLSQDVFDTDGVYKIRLNFEDQEEEAQVVVDPVFGIKANGLEKAYKLGETIEVSGQVSKNKEAYPGAVDLEFIQSGRVETVSVTADETGHYNYVFNSLGWGGGTLNIKAKHENVESKVATELESYTVLTLNDIDARYMYGDQVTLAGYLEKDGQPLQAELTLRASQPGQEDQNIKVESDKTGQYSLEYDTKGLKEGAITFTAAYGADKAAGESFIEYDYMLYASTDQASYYVSEKALISGLIRANKEAISGPVEIVMDGKEPVKVTADPEGTFAHTWSGKELGIGNHKAMVIYKNKSMPVTFEIVEDTFEADLKLSSDSIDYGQGLSLSGQLIKNGQPVKGRAQIEVVLVTASGERVKHQTELLSDDNGTCKADLSQDVFDTDGVYKVRLNFEDQEKEAQVVVDPVFDIKTNGLEKAYKLGETIEVSGQVSKNKEAYPGAVDLEFTQSGRVETVSVTADETGHYNYVFNSLGWGGGTLSIKAKHENVESKVATELESYTVLTLSDIDARYMYGDQVTLAGYLEKDGQPLQAELTLRASQPGQEDQIIKVESDKTGQYSLEYDTKGLKEGAITFTVAYGADKAAGESLIEYDYMLYVTPLSGLYQANDKIEITGYALTNGEKPDDNPYLRINGDMYVKELVQRGNGNFKLNIRNLGLGVGTYTFEVVFHDVTYTQTLDIVPKKNNSKGSNNSSASKTQTPTDSRVVVSEEQVPQGPIEQDVSSVKSMDVKSFAKALENSNGRDVLGTLSQMSHVAAGVLSGSSLSPAENKQVVEELSSITNKAVDNMSLTADDVKAVMKNAIETIIKPAAESDVLGLNINDLNKIAKALVEKAVKKSAELKVVADQSDFSVESVKQILEKAVETTEEMKTDLVKNGFDKVAAELSPVIDIKLESKSSDKEIAFSNDMMKAIKDSGAKVEIDLQDMTFTMPAELLKAFDKTDMVLKSDKLDREEKQVLKNFKSSDGVEVDIVSDVYEIEFKSQGQDIDLGKTKPELSIDVSEMTELLGDYANTLGVYVFDESANAWSYVPSRIIDGKAVFEAPHFSKYAVLKTNIAFDDIKGHWAKETIEMMTANQITAGRTDDAFEPDAKITRAEFASYLVNMLGLEGQLGGNFKDVSEDAWYYDAVGKAAVNGLVNGVGEGNFAPDAPVSRQDMAVMLAKAYKIINGVEMKGEIDVFTDSALISEYAHEAVYAAKYHNIVGGFADGSFRPLQTATRAEATQMLRAFWESN